MPNAASLSRAVAALLLAASPLAQATAASYASEVVAPTVAVRNTPYRAAFPLLGAPPADGRITTVYYAWQFSYRPPGLTVKLCQGSRCLDVSKDASGTSAAFRGLSPSQPFQLHYAVGGSGAIMPLLSGKQQLAVSYTF
ncbi:flagellar protein FlhE [Vogesella facilis]|uniref:Flagellar protein FlhE n=1 Tax=Vogesella facilis TaxID=1655232 RepID=A0ABV7RAR8_9NEIS